jgi:hypothetical protein
MIIIGTVSILFRKKKVNTGRSQNKPFSTNAFEEIRTLVKKQLSYDEIRKNSPIIPEKKTDMPLTNLENFQNKNQLKQDSSVSRIGVSKGENKRDQMKVDTIQDKESLISLYPDEKTLLNGIIWSEVLGEPRSKKPYFPRKG